MADAKSHGPSAMISLVDERHEDALTHLLKPGAGVEPHVRDHPGASAAVMCVPVQPGP